MFIKFLPKGNYLTKKCILTFQFWGVYNETITYKQTQESEVTVMNTNWAYGFGLNHEGAGVGTIYYAAKYFERDGIINPASGEAYTSDEIKAIKENASEGAEKYFFDVPENAVIGMNVLGSDKTFWYDEDNSAKITACANPLGLDASTGDMKDQEGNVVAVATK